MEIYDLFSPIDYRYHSKELIPYLSEKAFMDYKIKAELCIVRGFWEQGLCSYEIFEEITRACARITYEEVIKEEKRTRHDVRALVNCIRRKLKNRAKCFVHLGVTSSDIVDSANAARYRDAVLQVIMPNLVYLSEILTKIAKEEANTIQVGRTHGQHATPITFGFWAANFLSRLDLSIAYLSQLAKRLPGKLSGAVGTYTAINMALVNLSKKQNIKKTICPRKFEKLALSYLGLEPADCSTQITHPEAKIRLFNELTVVMGIMANLSRDLRHLQRTEIAEIGEAFGENQIGSSTMPHKQNPITFENIESLWKIVMPRMQTIFMDQISEHQRDLTGSASSRTYAEIIVYVNHAATSLATALKSLTINKERMTKNALTDDKLAAEQIYIYMATAMKSPNAYEKVREWVQKAQQEGVSLKDIICKDELFNPKNPKKNKKAKFFLEEILSLIKDAAAPHYLANEIAQEIAKPWQY